MKGDKDYQFAKFCMSLTKQGLQFTRSRDFDYAIEVDLVNKRRLSHPDTTLPFEDTAFMHEFKNGHYYYIPIQWADRNRRKQTLYAKKGIKSRVFLKLKCSHGDVHTFVEVNGKGEEIIKYRPWSFTGKHEQARIYKGFSKLRKFEI